MSWSTWLFTRAFFSTWNMRRHVRHAWQRVSKHDRILASLYHLAPCIAGVGYTQ